MCLGGSRGFWLTLMAAVVIAGVLFWLWTSSNPFMLIVLFDDAGELKRGDPVLWRSFAVGKVEKVEPLVDNKIGVTIRLHEDYAGKIARGSEFVLKRASLMGFVGQNAVEIRTPDAPGAPFQNGEKVQGVNTPAGSLVEQGKKASLEFWEQLRDRAARLADDFQNSPYRKEAAEALQAMGELAERGARQAKEGIDRFREEHREEIDRIVRRLESLRDQMRRAGDESGAARVEQEMDTLKGKSPK